MSPPPSLPDPFDSPDPGDHSASQHRFPKTDRLLRRSDFLRVQGQGRKLVSPHFLWFVVPSPAGALRLGVTVSKRVGGAVVRNRVKRLLREAFRHHKALFPVGIDVVAIARTEAATVPLAVVDRELCDAARRLTPRGSK